MAQPGRPDIECKISPDLLKQIEAIAQSQSQSRTAATRSLWFAGVVAIMAQSVESKLPEKLKAIAEALPEFDEVPVGSELLKFNVPEQALEWLKAAANRQGKKVAQLHRNALAIGIWVYEQIGIIGGMADEGSY